VAAWYLYLKTADNNRMEEGACLVKKNIVKPCTGKPYARFDKGGQAKRDYGKTIEAPSNERGCNGYPDLRVRDAYFLLYFNFLQIQT